MSHPRLAFPKMLVILTSMSTAAIIGCKSEPTPISTPHLRLSTVVTAIAASTIFEIVKSEVVSGIINKLVLDPLWDLIIGDKKENVFSDELKEELAGSIVKKIQGKLINPTGSHEKTIEIECAHGETEEMCRLRLASKVQAEVHEAQAQAQAQAQALAEIYHDELKATYQKCRDRIVDSPITGPLDYNKQVDLIIECMSKNGYQEEVSLMLSKIQGSAT